MQNLISYLSDFMNFWTLLDVILISFFAGLSLYFYKRNKPLIEKVKNYQFFSTCSAQTIEDYEHQLKLNECKEIELKNAFEDAVAEITELRSNKEFLETKIDALNVENKSLTDMYEDKLSSMIYWKERALHQKHTKTKQVDSEWWECKKQILPFNKGIVYNEDKTAKHSDNSLIWLFASEYDLHPYLVPKKYFRPIEK